MPKVSFARLISDPGRTGLPEILRASIEALKNVLAARAPA